MQELSFIENYPLGIKEDGMTLPFFSSSVISRLLSKWCYVRRISNADGDFTVVWVISEMGEVEEEFSDEWNEDGNLWRKYLEDGIIVQ